MGNPIVSADFQRLFDKNIREVMDGKRKYNEVSAMIPKLFRTINSDNDKEEFYSVGKVPDIPEFGGELTALSVAPGYHTKIEPKEFAAKLTIQRKFLDDKKWSVFNDNAGSLQDAADRTREKRAVRIFTLAQSSAFDFQISEEGVAWSSSSHTTKSGVSTATGFDNAGVSALSKTSVAATWILMHQLKDDIGEMNEPSGNIGIIVPFNLVDKAEEIVGTPKGLNTAEGNVNPQYKRYTIIPYPRLDVTDTNDWTMVDLDSMRKDLVFINRISDDVTSHIDFQTFMTEISLYFRCGFGVLDWRWGYNHKVA